jgi:hypothetical protein
MKISHDLLRVATRLLTTAAWVVSTALVGACAYYSTYSTWPQHDDEGSLMLYVRHFFENPGGQQLGVYGPFYYLYKYSLHQILPIPLSSDGVRVGTITCWAGASLAAGLATARLTRAFALGLLVFCQTFLHIRMLTNEPGHPQELNTLLTGCLILIATLLATRNNGGGWWFILGALPAAVALSKINVGVFLGLALSLTLSAHFHHERVSRVAFHCLAVVALCLPTVLMWRHLHDPATTYYCVAVTSALAAALLQARLTKSEILVQKNHLLLVGAGAASIGLLTLLSLASLGASVTMIEDTLGIRAATLFSVRLKPFGTALQPSAVLAGTSALVACLLSTLIRYKWETLVFRLSVLTAKFVLGLGIFYTSLYQSLWLSNLLLGAATPFLWLLMLRCPSHQAFSRCILCFTAILNGLQAYPVHGSQAYLSTFLLLPAAGVLLGDAWREGADLLKSFGTQLVVPSWSRHVGTAAVVCLVVWFYSNRLDYRPLQSAHSTLQPLNAPGPTRIRLPARFVGGLQCVANNVPAYCDDFVSWPGMPSLHFWTPVPPTALYTGPWILIADMERAILQRFHEPGRHCVVYFAPSAKSWVGERDPWDTPFMKYIKDTFHPLLTRHGFWLLVDKKNLVPDPSTMLLYGQRNFQNGRNSHITLSGGIISERTSLSIRMWLRTRASGAALGYQATPRGGNARPNGWTPIVYVGTDGKLRAQLWNGNVGPITTDFAVNDGTWHHAVLVAQNTRQSLYVDGKLVGELAGQLRHQAFAFAQVGSAYSRQWPSANSGWFDFEGTLADVILDPRPLSATEVQEYFDVDPPGGDRITRRANWS